MFVEYSTPTQPWTSIPGSWDADSGSATISYSSSGTTYFRIRAGNSGSSSVNGSSTYSDVLVVPGGIGSTLFYSGTSDNDTIVLKEDSDGEHIDCTINGNAETELLINSSHDLLVQGEGGDDSITFDLSNGDFLAGVAAVTIENNGGSMNLKIIGQTSNDTVSIVGIGTTPYIVDGTVIHVLAGAINSLEYDDGGGNDSIASYSTAGTPVIIDTGSGNDAIDLETSNSVTVNSASSSGGTETVGTGGSAEPNLTFNASSGTIKVAASSGFAIGNGIRQLKITSIDIASSAKIVFANSSSTLGDYSNHASRSVVIVAAGGLSIASGGTLDMGDNDMILNYGSVDGPTTDTQVFNLLATGISALYDWSGTGITSSEANYDADYSIGARALGWVDNSETQYSSWDGVTLAANNQEVLIKFTYYGDANLDGVVDTFDTNQVITGRDHDPGNTGWYWADFDYDAVTSTSTDQNLFFTGRSAYDTYGAL